MIKQTPAKQQKQSKIDLKEELKKERDAKKHDDVVHKKNKADAQTIYKKIAVAMKHLSEELDNPMTLLVAPPFQPVVAAATTLKHTLANVMKTCLNVPRAPTERPGWLLWW